jgi:hypothetical protein
MCIAHRAASMGNFAQPETLVKRLGMNGPENSRDVDRHGFFSAATGSDTRKMHSARFEPPKVTKVGAAEEGFGICSI